MTSENVVVHRKSESFAKVPYELIKDKRLSDGAVRQYAYMHWRYGSNQDNHEGRASIARSMGVSEATVSKRIAELEAAGWVVVIERKRPDTNEQDTNAYHVFEVAGDAKEFRESFQCGELEIMRIAPPMPDRKGRTGIGGRPKKTQVNTGPDKLEFTHVDNSSLQELDAVDPDAKDSPAQEAAPEAPRYAVGMRVVALGGRLAEPLEEQRFDIPDGTLGTVIGKEFVMRTLEFWPLVQFDNGVTCEVPPECLAPAPRYRDTSDDPLDKVGRCCDKCHSILSICDEGLYCNECGWIPPADPPTPPTPKRGRASKTKPAKPAYWGDLVAAVIKEFGEPGGKASKIAEQLAGVAYQGERKDCNCNPPATPEEIAPFIKWYRGEYPGLDLPTSAEALESQWHKFNTFKTKQQHAAAFTPTLDYEPAEPDPHDYLRIPVYEPLGAPA